MANKDNNLINGKPFDELTNEEFLEAIERGDIEVPDATGPKPEELYTMQRLEKFLMGDITWAQFQGMTMDEAYNVAEYGYQLFQEGRFHDALKIFEGLVICNAYDAYFHTMLGATYQQLDMVDEALEQYGIAVDIDPKHLHAYVNRGELRLQRSEFEGALQDLKHALEIDPTGKDEAGRRAQVLAAATHRAITEVNKLLAQAKSDKA